MESIEKITVKDLTTDQEVRWCPGCGDYSILKQAQSVLAEIGIKRENTVFISGIGCSSRFPYYMETFGMHSIHGRATAMASGLKAARPDLDIWIVTGDGDALSIGGNHFIHLLRRNFNVNVLLFNNEIYGLTKGQYSPTTPRGTINKSAPMGTIDYPFNPLALSLGAGGSFIARSMDRDPKHLRETLLRATRHKGTSLVEIYQNCNVFNDGAFSAYTEKESRPGETIFLENGKPIIFGAAGNKGIKLDGFKPVIVNLEEGHSANDLWIHDETDQIKAGILTRFFDDITKADRLPRPFGVFYTEDRYCYEDALKEQIDRAVESRKAGDLDALLRGKNTWEIN